jgi:hypothetical protein
MSRTNVLLSAGVVVLLVIAGVAGQLAFVKNHPGGLAAAPTAPGSAGDTPTVPAGMPPTGAEATGAPSGAPQGMPVGQDVQATGSAASFDLGPGPADGKPLPDTLADLPLVNRNTGEKALGQIAQLTGKDLPVSEAELVSYGNDAERAVLWVAVAKDKPAAQAIFQEFLHLGPENSAFTQPKELPLKGKAIIITSGNEMKHYFFLRANRIYWLALVIPDVNRRMQVMSYMLDSL